jgi:addiction module HigA family antidote
MTRKLLGISPGEILREEFLRPMGITAYRLAKETRLSPMRISEILRGKRAISADTALRLARFFGNSPVFWTNLQSQHDLEVRRNEIAAELDAIRPFSRESTRP